MLTKPKAPQRFTLPYAEAFDITSASGAEFRVSVGFPRSYATAERTYPVLYVLDGDMYFCTVLEVARSRAMVNEIDELIIVGIGYPLGTDDATRSGRRTYDFSSEEWNLSAPLARWLTDSLAAIGQSLRIGGATPFLDFLTADLPPVINERYRTNPSACGIIGHSAGGNLLGHALFRASDAFESFIVGSPAFACNDSAVLKLEEQYALQNADLEAVLYLGAAADEWKQLPASDVVSGTGRLAEQLATRQYPGLRLTCEFFNGETHQSVYTSILRRGLEICWPRAIQ